MPADATDPATGPESLPPHLRSIYDDSQKTPGGRAFYEAADADMFTAAQELAPQGDQYTVDVHGTADSVSVGDQELSPNELAQLVRADPDWNGRDVFLMSCETGQREHGFADEFADELGVGVTAPDELGWSDPGPDSQPYSTTGYVDPGTGALTPDLPANGSFHPFAPDSEHAHPSADRQASSDGSQPVADAERDRQDDYAAQAAAADDRVDDSMSSDQNDDWISENESVAVEAGAERED